MPDFRINPLQLPDSVRATPLDFRPLGEIGDVVALNRRRQQIADTLSGATDPSGNLDVERAGTELARIGLLDEARPVLALAQQKAALAQTLRHQQATEQLGRDQLTLARQQYENPKPTVHIVPGQFGASQIVETAPGRAPIVQQPVLTPQPGAAAAPPPAPAPAKPLVDVGNPPVPPAPAAAAPNEPPATEPAPAPAPPPQRRSEYLPVIDEAKLARYPENVREQIRQVAEYKVNPVTIAGTRGTARQDFANAAQDVTNGAYDATKFANKQQTLNAFGKGLEARQVRAVSNLVEHLDLADQLVKALGGSDIGLIRSLQTKWKELTGSEAPANIEAAAPIISGELLKVIAQSGGGGVAERLGGVATLIGQGKGQAQTLGGINQMRALMAPQLQNLENQYEANTFNTDFRTRLLRKPARDFLEAYEGKHSGAAKPATAAPPQVGQVNIPMDAARALQANPERRDEFDAKYGAGASDRVLGRRR